MAGDREITFEYVQPKGLKTIHADGAFGGWTPRKQFRIDFTVDLWDPPKTEKRSYNEQGEPIGPATQHGARPNIMLRESQVRVVMSEDAVRRLFEWLQEKLGTGPEEKNAEE